MAQHPTTTIEFTGERCAARLVALLIHESLWFTCLPLPDDRWRFEVRIGDEHRLFAAFKQAAVETSTVPTPVTAPTARTIFQVLDVSTQHVTEKDCAALADAGSALPVFPLADYGFLVYAHDADENWEADEMSPEFFAVLTLALAQNCDYVRFDRDGPVYDDLPTFDW